MTAAARRFEHIACPVCDGGDFIPLFEQRGETFVRCRGCGLVLINPRPVFDVVADTYDAAYSGGYIRKAAKKRARSRRWVARIKRRFVPRGRWLDVGCSAGFVVAAAAAAGYEAWGVELEAAAVAFARETLKLPRIACGTLEAQRYPAGHFDVLSMYDVIEHVPDLNATVAELKRLLAPGGAIEIRTPDVGHFTTPRRLDTWREIKPSEHLYYFDRHTLPRLFARHGLVLRERRLMWKSALDHVYAHAEVPASR
ncbi:MAG TPA: class I SAM-dependent methyltransferase [Gammaproteobacteria bacterium]|nr:class I SAM-dependent methyltransferase [Gammaproteobacteria bacterium]